MKLFLIGMPGSGKSTLGKELAKTLMLSFFDLDKVIEDKSKKRVQDIFQENGEDFFRELEANQLRYINSHHHSFVLACGGGTPCFHNSLKFMKKEGKVIFLDTDIDTLYTRLHQSANRPLLALESDTTLKARLEKMRHERIAFYEQADFIFSKESLTANVIANTVVESVYKKTNSKRD